MTFKSDIERLINALGETPRPDYPAIRSALVKFAHLAGELEGSKPLLEAEAKATAVENQNAALKVQIAELRAALDSANTEIGRLCKEEEQRNAKRAELEEAILKFIAYSGETDASDLAESCDLSFDRVEVVLHDLHKAGLVHTTRDPVKTHGVPEILAIYDLTIEGTRYLLNQGHLH